jgi:hypothetical protein
VRTPGRLITLTSLGLALLAAAGTDRIAGLVRRRFTVAASLACAGVLVLGVLVEGRGSMPNPAVPPAPAVLAASPAPQIDLPANAAFDRVYQLWSSDRFQPIVNGVSTFSIPSLGNLMSQMDNFPDRRSVATLRRIGVRTVFIHTDITRLPIPRKWMGLHPPNARAAAARSVAGLPLRRTRVGSVVRYDLDPVARPTHSLAGIGNG